MTVKKYELIPDDTVRSWDGRTLFRIRALVAIAAFGVAVGEVGGYVESEAHLSQSGNAWVSGNAQVCGNAWVSGNARVYGDARVYDNAWVYGNARVYGDARVCGNARVYGDARVCGNARVYGDARVYDNAWVYGDAQVYGDARVCGNAWVSGNARVYGDARVYGKIIVGTRSDGYTFLVTPTTDGLRIIAGCRYFTFDQARAHWQDTRSGTQLGAESLALVDHLERMAVICKLAEQVPA